MNIEEKLQTLTNSVQALVELHAQNERRMARFEEKAEGVTNSVELLSSMHQGHEKRFAQAVKVLGGRNARLEDLVTQIAEGTARLLHVVEEHEHRINDLEGKQTEQ